MVQTTILALLLSLLPLNQMILLIIMICMHIFTSHLQTLGRDEVSRLARRLEACDSRLEELVVVALVSGSSNYLAGSLKEERHQEFSGNWQIFPSVCLQVELEDDNKIN